MRVAYADPPYVGQARKHYGSDAREVNHELLIAHLSEFDAWALSCSSPSLKTILPLCPDDSRVMAWVKPFTVFKNVNPAYAWEPVIVRAPKRGRERGVPHIMDWVSEPIHLAPETDGARVPGAKPRAFSWWLFRVLNLSPDDEFVDLFPGSGAVGRAWDAFTRQGRLIA